MASIIKDNKNDEKDNDVINFLLQIDKKLWEKFCETIPPYFTRNQALVMMIKERVESLRGKEEDVKGNKG